MDKKERIDVVWPYTKVQVIIRSNDEKDNIVQFRRYSSFFQRFQEKVGESLDRSLSSFPCPPPRLSHLHTTH